MNSSGELCEQDYKKIRVVISGIAESLVNAKRFEITDDNNTTRKYVALTDGCANYICNMLTTIANEL